MKRAEGKHFGSFWSFWTVEGRLKKHEEGLRVRIFFRASAPLRPYEKEPSGFLQLSSCPSRLHVKGFSATQSSHVTHQRHSRTRPRRGSREGSSVDAACGARAGVAWNRGAHVQLS